MCIIRTAVAVAAAIHWLVLPSASAPVAYAATAENYIVLLTSGSDPDAVAASIGAVPTATYTAAIDGFAAPLTKRQLSALGADPRMVTAVPDREVRLSPEPRILNGHTNKPPPGVLPVGEQRIGVLESPTAHLDHIDDRVDVDIAILDTGVQMNHPDLNVVGGVNCIAHQHNKKPTDGDGHGTHVAGTAAALDNDFGVVGVAPGARIWAVKVLDDTGNGTISQVICGIDWVTAHADVIDVANMSLGDFGADDGNCGRTNGDLEHMAVCASVEAGVTYVVAAGNESTDASTLVPAAYPEVITASAFADWDGLPGGLASPFPGCTQVSDDAFAFFSNFGSRVDLAAPGVCVVSTYKDSSYAAISGTSMASPHVAGAVALYLATHPGTAPADVRQALIDRQESGPVAGDPDAFPEGSSTFAGCSHLPTLCRS